MRPQTHNIIYVVVQPKGITESIKPLDIIPSLQELEVVEEEPERHHKQATEQI